MSSDLVVFVGDGLAKYGFPEGHPFSVDRQGAFWNELQCQGLDKRVRIEAPREASHDELLRFHTPEHVELVRKRSKAGFGYLDYGDTPAFPGVFEAAATVTGSALEGLERVMAGETLRTFQAIGGMHHARRHGAAGFCVFNDLGLIIDTLRLRHGVKRVAYVDIDVHHGDGVFYSYEHDPDLILADIHEDGRYLYPGTGHAFETGRDEAKGTKLNIPLAPGAGNREFFEAWERVLDFLRQGRPEFIIFQCGADSLMGDPLAHLCFTPAAHAHAAKTLRTLAEEMCKGRMMAFGGGGYDLENLAAGWCAVVDELSKL